MRSLARSNDGLSEVQHRAGLWPCETSDDPQQSRLARARAPEKTEDFAFVEREVHAVEDDEVRRLGSRQSLTDSLDFEHHAIRRHLVGPRVGLAQSSRMFCSASR